MCDICAFSYEVSEVDVTRMFLSLLFDIHTLVHMPCILVLQSFSDSVLLIDYSLVLWLNTGFMLDE